jgi:glycosyltransferase involved in cell wall biosynthesis
LAKRLYFLIPGGLEHAGGIGRMNGYLIAAWSKDPAAPAYRVLDTRGSGHIAWSLLYFGRALLVIFVQALRGNILALHVNLSHGGSTLRKAIAIRLAALLGVPALIHLNSSDFREFYHGLPAWLQAHVRLMFKRARKTVVVGRHWEQFLTADVGVEASCIEVIYNAVPAVSERGPNRESRPKGNGCNILFLGRLGERKGVPDLLAALSQEKLHKLAWHATLAGDGEVACYRKLADSLGLSRRVTFTGWLSQPEAQRFLRQADILVLPSYNEGLPLAVLEALAGRVAVITTPVGATPEIIENEVSGLLVDPGDIRRLTDALQRLITDAAFRDALADGGYASFERHANIEHVAARFLEIYREILGDQRSLVHADSAE